jgi:succinate dehydrogenase hydrophobic anchor subunit
VIIGLMASGGAALEDIASTRGRGARRARACGFPVLGSRANPDASHRGGWDATTMELNWALIEKRVTTAALVAAPLLTVAAMIAMLWSPHEFAESDTASGTSLWLGAAFGLVMVLVVYALPQLAFGLALRSGRPRWLTFTAVASPLLAVFCLVPFVGALVNGWNGVSPVAVITVACAGVLDCFVFVVALRRLRHGHDPLHPAVTPRG